MTYEEEQESAIRALREQEEQDALESEMVKAQYIESFSGQELLYSKKVQKLVEAANNIKHKVICFDAGNHRNGKCSVCDPLEKLVKALEEFKGVGDD